MTKKVLIKGTVLVSVPVEVEMEAEKWNHIKDDISSVEEMFESSYEEHLHNAHLYNVVLSDVEDVEDED